MSEAGVITVAMTVLATVVWAVRVEGIVRAHEQQIAQLRADMTGRIDEVLIEVRYMRDRLDAVLRLHRD